MSYTQRYRATIHQSYRYNYPASQSGGTGTLDVEMPVDINIFVDTNSYDQQVGIAAGKLLQLSATVDEAKNAEMVSIRKNSETIASTIVGGFFSYIRSDLSQQISELRPKSESKIIELMKQKEAALSKMGQMTEDFNRIAARYTKIFSELDKEAKNRILSLDASSFAVQRTLFETINIPVSGKLLSTATITSREETSIRSKIVSSRLKTGTMLLIGKAKDVITSYNRLGQRLKAILVNEASEEGKRKYLPVIFSEAVYGEGEMLLECHTNSEFSPFKAKGFSDKIESIYRTSLPEFQTLDSKTGQQLSAFIKREIDAMVTGESDHNTRVKNLIWSLWAKNNDLQINRDK